MSIRCKVLPMAACLEGCTVPAQILALAPTTIPLAHAAALPAAAQTAWQALFDVAVELQVWPEVPHVFQGFAALLDDADRALLAAAAFIKRNWAR